MKVVYICSPYRADDVQEHQENLDLAKRACEHAIREGVAPICPQLYFSQFIKEEEKALAAGLALVTTADELWVMGTRISPGMAAEIQLATELAIPVRCLPDPQVAEERLLEAIFMNKTED